ncbi:hypothetical protein HWV23_05270 [Natronomonas halophila]|uniref:hypothetical protein n=1 Tax=Natronomonas halophila TaxID=2747817 RepID=UPI0015B437E9|nr:hypothetical protein [Natronomonas halophila]QLD85157.1 hypothetical protein HWV23_05270 [Natronomonas halophila]
MSRRRRFLLVAVGVFAGLVGSVAAHGAGLASAPDRGTDVPTWLFLLTGGGVIGASFLLASFITDRSFIRAIHRSRGRWTPPAKGTIRRLGGVIGVIGLGFVLGVGFFGPREALYNAAVLLVWAGWWSGYAMTTYLVGNSWPLVNPWRAIAEALPSLDREYPERFGAWPSVVGLLALVWLEVISPVADRPRILAGVVLGYTLLTLAGAVVFGPVTWFETVDPIARVFRYFGRVAPLHYDDGIRVRLPGAGLNETALVSDRSEVGFVVAILWVTTYDGLVATPPWRRFAVTVVEAGVPAHLLYPAALVAGYAVFLGVFRVAAVYSKRHARTYTSADALARRFAPPLLAIAAGYHLAHFLGYFVELSPALFRALAAPLAPPAPVAVVLPSWFTGVEIAFVILGHLLAIWAAHAAAYEVFPGKMQAIRSQYAVTLAMVCYTMLSLWIVTQPYATPPYVS